MAEEIAKPKRPGVVRKRVLPPDPMSLEAMWRVLHRWLMRRGEQLKRSGGSKDGKTRRGFRVLFGERAKVWAALYEKDPERAIRLAAEFQLIIPTPIQEGGVS